MLASSGIFSMVSERRRSRRPPDSETLPALQFDFGVFNFREVSAGMVKPETVRPFGKIERADFGSPHPGGWFRAG